MRKLRALLVGAALSALAIIGIAVAQTGVFTAAITGNETWSVGNGAGGPSYFMSLNQARNTTGYQLLAAASGTVAPTAAVNSLLVNAQPANSTTINTPISSPTALLSDGQLFQVCNVSNAAWVTNTVTLAASTGQSFATGVTTNLTTLAARTCIELQYVLSTTTWYQVR